MKKLFCLGALALSVFSFAKTSEVSNVKEELKKEESQSSNKFFGGVYTVTFTLPCNGQTYTAWYYTTTDEGTQAFNEDLAWAVNTSVDLECGSGSSGVNTGV